MNMDNMFELDYGTYVKFYPYRTATIRDVIFIIDRMSNEAREFEKKLAIAAHVNTDNHSMYAVSTRDGSKTLYIFCSDFKMYVGLGYEECHW